MKRIYQKPEIRTIDIVLPKLLGDSMTIPVNTEPEDPSIDNPDDVF